MKKLTTSLAPIATGLSILAAALLPLTSGAQPSLPPPPPPNTNGPCTNCPPPQPIIWFNTNGTHPMIHHYIITNDGTTSITTVVITNTLLNHFYSLQSNQAPTGFGPTNDPQNMIDPPFIGGGTGTSQTNRYTNMLSKWFFNSYIADSTVFITNNGTNYSSGGGGDGSGNPPNNYVGYAIFNKTVANGWGFVPDTNTPYHYIVNAESPTNTYIVALGRSLDTYATNGVLLLPLGTNGLTYSSAYRMAEYFYGSMPTNTNHVLNAYGFH